MNSTTVVTDTNLPGVSCISTDNSLVTVHVPTSHLIESPNSFFTDVLLLGNEEPNSPTCDVDLFVGKIPETIYIEGEAINPAINPAINDSPLLIRDPNLFSVAADPTNSKSCECFNGIKCDNCIENKREGPPPKKRTRMLPPIKRLNFTADTSSSSSDSPPSPSHVNWPCAFCERFFTGKNNLYRHYRTMHPNRHCAQCVNPSLDVEMNMKKKNNNNLVKKNVKKRKENRKKSREEVENELKLKFNIKECHVMVKNLKEGEIFKLTRLSPLPRRIDFPRMYSGSSRKMENLVVENDDSLVGNDVLIGSDILTEEVVIEEDLNAVKDGLSCDKVTSPKKCLGRNENGDDKEDFKCDFCDEIFDHKIALMSHKRFKHSENLVPKLQCDKCKEEFALLIRFQDHIQRCNVENLSDSCGSSSSFYGRNLFEELTNFRSSSNWKKYGNNGLSTSLNNSNSKDLNLLSDNEEDDDSIIKQAELQLVNSPTSKGKVDDRRDLFEEKSGAKKRKLDDDLDEKRSKLGDDLDEKRSKFEEFDKSRLRSRKRSGLFSKLMDESYINGEDYDDTTSSDESPVGKKYMKFNAEDSIDSIKVKRTPCLTVTEDSFDSPRLKRTPCLTVTEVSYNNINRKKTPPCLSDMKDKTYSKQMIIFKNSPCSSVTENQDGGSKSDESTKSTKCKKKPCMSPKVFVSRVKTEENSQDDALSSKNQTIKRKRGRPPKTSRNKSVGCRLKRKIEKEKITVENMINNATQTEFEETKISPRKRRKDRPKKTPEIEQNHILQEQHEEVKSELLPDLNSNVSGIKLFDEDDCSFSSVGTEGNKIEAIEDEFVDIEEDDLNLTLSDDDDESSEINIMDVTEGDNTINIGAEVSVVDVCAQEKRGEVEKKSRNISDCFSVLV